MLRCPRKRVNSSPVGTWSAMGAPLHGFDSWGLGGRGDLQQRTPALSVCSASASRRHRVGSGQRNPAPGFLLLARHNSKTWDSKSGVAAYLLIASVQTAAAGAGSLAWCRNVANRTTPLAGHRAVIGGYNPTRGTCGHTHSSPASGHVGFHVRQNDCHARQHLAQRRAQARQVAAQARLPHPRRLPARLPARGRAVPALHGPRQRSAPSTACSGTRSATTTRSNPPTLEAKSLAREGRPRRHRGGRRGADRGPRPARPPLDLAGRQGPALLGHPAARPADERGAPADARRRHRRGRGDRDARRGAA